MCQVEAKNRIFRNGGLFRGIELFSRVAASGLRSPKGAGWSVARQPTMVLGELGSALAGALRKLGEHTVVDEEVMGVKHVGLVTGTGRFTLTPAGPGRTEFRWEEDLTFPMWMGGPLRNPVGGRVLEWIWRRNLTRLKDIVEATVASDS